MEESKRQDVNGKPEIDEVLDSLAIEDSKCLQIDVKLQPTDDQAKIDDDQNCLKIEDSVVQFDEQELAQLVMTQMVANATIKRP